MEDPSTALNDRCVKAARKVRVLSSLSWPEGTVQAFLEGWRRGQPTLPEVPPLDRDLDETCQALRAVARDADPDDPVEAHIARTAQSYAVAGEMLQHAGTSGFTDRSVALYGSPRQRLAGSTLTHHEAAEALLENTANLEAAGVLRPHDLCLTAESVKTELDEAFAAFFADSAPRVVIDEDLASKAAAGSRRVRIRGGTCFSEQDGRQLIEHEGFVHAGTALNGRAQPVLGCMGLSAPRTTKTQEGLATLAELVTRTTDIIRLRRLALRTVAIHQALEGADYIEVFRFFLESGQSEDESAHSAMRVFRGGDVRGAVCFTKDIVYLSGLLSVHTFFRKAIADGQPHLIARLFAGRMTLGDVFALGPSFEDGRVAPARFVPPWATATHQLAAYLCFSALTNRIDLSSLDLNSVLDDPG
ncbi:MAG: flavohemoglobin expression-modulating QEGLA motif protein [Sandaracinaceae bacterium]